MILQLVTILISRGDVYMLGEAYAFGVVWSFAMKALSVLVLRYKQPGGREWKVPLNFHIGGTEIPVGLVLITVALFALAIINVLTKKVATISGVSFTIAFFMVFELSERYNRRRTKARHDRSWRSSAWIRTRIWPPRPSACGRATCWWRCAIPTGCSTWTASWPRPTRASMDIVVLSVRQVTQAASGEHALETGADFLRRRNRPCSRTW